MRTFNRRAFVAAFAGLGTAFVAFRASCAAIDEAASSVKPPRIPAFTIPRGVLVESYLSQKCMGVQDPGISITLTIPGVKPVMAIEPCIFVMLVSTGRELVPVDSLEGQAVLNSMAVNLRSDGSLAHRQHHPTDFPRGR